METSLHRQLKQLYATSEDQTEVRIGCYRIDVVVADQLIEIQHGSLFALRDKVQSLVVDYRLLVVKPLVVRKLLVKQKSKRGPVVSRRMSPKRGGVLDLFDDLVYFTQVFPHPNLALEVILVDIEEWRYPRRGNRRRSSARDYHILDQRLIRVQQKFRLQTAHDLLQLKSMRLPKCFNTADLAKALGVERWKAQRIAYCFRQIGTTKQVRKQGNTLVYEFSQPNGAAS